MHKFHKESDYDSSQQEDEVNINYFDRIKYSKSADKHQFKQMKRPQKIDVDQPQQDQQFQLKPKLTVDFQNNSKVIANNSGVSQATSYVNRRPLTAAYTFKLKTPTKARKKTDPVSLFQQTSQMWKKDKFLTNRANNKQGRKLELDKRNRQINKI